MNKNQISVDYQINELCKLLKKDDLYTTVE